MKDRPCPPTLPRQLFTSLYRELHRVAARQLRLGGSGSTLGATTLLHECYLNMADRDTTLPQFSVYAVRAMCGRSSTIFVNAAH